MRVLFWLLVWAAASVWLAAMWSWIAGALRKRSAPAVDWDAVLERWCRDEGCLHRQPFDDLFDVDYDTSDWLEPHGGQGGS